jgi:alkaline phosphatase D
MPRLLILFIIAPFFCFGQKTTTIAFGSCGYQGEPLPIFDVINKHKPQYFIFLGDNIYGDTDTMAVLKKKYQQLAAKPGFQALKKQSKLFATWDDHDFGRNDAGRHYPFKAASKEIFLDFFNEPKTSTRRQHEGIYHAEYLKIGNRTIQILLLDVRSFRDNLPSYIPGSVKDKRYFYELDYSPHLSEDSTLLGPQQWKWLETELKKKADLRLVCSGSQFSIEYNGYEAWANYPLEQQRMINLIKSTKAEGLMFLTGDVHYAEISKLAIENCYPLYDITASGLSSTWYFATPNINRIEGPIMDNHFGLLTINWQAHDPKLTMEIWDIRNNQRIEHNIKLSDLRFKK